VSGPSEEEEKFTPGVSSEADYVTTALKTQEGFLGAGAGETAKYAGRVGHDVRAMREDLKEQRYHQLKREFVHKWERGADQEELEQMESQARVWASEQIAAKYMDRRGQGGNELFIDIDPRGRIDALSKWAEDSYVGYALAPLWASMLGIDVEFRETSPEDPNQPERVTYNEGDAWGGFDWLTRMTPGTQLATMTEGEAGPLGIGFMTNALTGKAQEAWGSEEHIENIMEGRDLISEADRLNLSPIPDSVANILGQVTGVEWMTGLKGEQVADYTTALAMSFLDPDVFTLAGFLAAGPVGGVVSKGIQTVGDITRISDVARAAAKRTPGTAAFEEAKIQTFMASTEQAESALKAAIESGKSDKEALDAAHAALQEAGMSGEPLRAHLDFLVASRVRKGTPRLLQARQAEAARGRLLEAYRKEYGEESAIYRAVVDEFASAPEEGAGVVSSVSKALGAAEDELAEIDATLAARHEEVAELEKAEMAPETPAEPIEIPEVSKGRVDLKALAAKAADEPDEDWTMSIEPGVAPSPLQYAGLIDITPRQARDLYRALTKEMGSTGDRAQVSASAPRTITGHYLDWYELRSPLRKLGWPEKEAAKLKKIREGQPGGLEDVVGPGAREQVDLDALGVPGATPKEVEPVDLDALGVPGATPKEVDLGALGVDRLDPDELAEGYDVAPFGELLQAVQAKGTPTDWRDWTLKRRAQAPAEARVAADWTRRKLWPDMPDAAAARIEEIRAEVPLLHQKRKDAADRLEALKVARTKATRKKAAAKAADAAPIPANDMEAAVALTAAQMQHYTKVADYKHALGLQKMLKSFGASVSEGAKRVKGMGAAKAARRVQEIDAEIEETLSSVMGLAQEYAGVRELGVIPDVAPVAPSEEAQKTYNLAMRKLQMLGAERTDLLGDMEVSVIDALVDQTKEAADAAMEALNGAFKEAASRPGLKKTAQKSQTVHARSIGKIDKLAEKATQERVFGEFERALKDTRASFEALAGGKQGSDIAAQIMRTTQEGWRVYNDWAPGPLKATHNAVRGLSEAVKSVIGPAQDLFNVRDPEVAQVGVDGMGALRLTLGEMAEVAGIFEDDIEAALAAVKRYLTDGNQAFPLRGGVTSGNVGRQALDGSHGSVWGEAVPVLRHLAKTAKGGTGEAPKVVLALARMYAEGATGRMDNLGASIVLRNLEKSGGDIEQFMALMQRAPTAARKTGVWRHEVVEEVLETVIVDGEPTEQLVKRVRYATLEEAITQYKASPDFDPERLAKMLTEEGKAMRILSTAAAHARTLSDVSERMMGLALKKVALTAEGGEVLSENTPEGMAALQRAVYSMTAMADPTKTDPAGYRDALALFEALGMRSDQLKAYLSKKEAAIAGAISVGDRAVIPRALLQELEKETGKLVKSFDLYKAEDLAPLHQSVWRFAKGIFHLYNASLVTGLIFPKPSHFSAMTFGNFGQMWADEDLTTAARVTKESLSTFAPATSRFLPRGSRRLREAMSEAMGQPVGNILPTVVDTALNPDLAKFYDPALASNATKVKLPDGSVTTMGTLRKQAREYGVLSSFVSTTGLQDALVKHHQTSAWGKLLKIFGAPKKLYADVADTFEQRQRVSMFLDLITRKGVSPEEAARRVKNALYDWNYPMVFGEKEVLSQMMMFWTFQRKALGQGARLLSQPFTSTAAQNTGGFAARMMGQEATGFGSLKDMAKTVNAAQEAQRQAVEDEAYKQVYPWWAMRAGSREWMYTEKMDPEFAESVRRATGKKVTHEAYTLPSFTPLETVNTYFGIIEAALAADSMAGRVIDPTIEFAKESGGRVTSPAMVAALEALSGRQEEQWKKTGMNEYAIMDRKVVGTLNALGILEASNDAKTEGAVRLSPMGQAAYAFMTPLSYETIQFWEPLVEAATYEQSASEAILRAMRQYSGVYKSYYYNAEKIKEGDLKALDKHGGALERETERRDPFTWTPTAPTRDLGSGKKGGREPFK
jgi:hypothetical protein